MSLSAAEKRTALYRFYDARETLLYVGITNDPWRRWRQHVLEKPWYPQVKHQAVTWYDSERQARMAETRAIRCEKPLFNIAGAVRPPRARFNVRLEPIIAICAVWCYLPPVCAVATVYLHLPALVTIIVCLSMPVPFAMMLLMVGAPWVYRFGCWLDQSLRRASAPTMPETEGQAG